MEGLRGLYKGALASAAGIVPYVTVSFTVRVLLLRHNFGRLMIFPLRERGKHLEHVQVYRALSDKLASSLEARNTWLYPAAKVGIGASAAMLGQVSKVTQVFQLRHLFMQMPSASQVHSWL